MSYGLPLKSAPGTQTQNHYYNSHTVLWRGINKKTRSLNNFGIVQMRIQYSKNPLKTVVKKTNKEEFR